MITDGQTDLLYLSEKIRERKDFSGKLFSLLQTHHIAHEFLPLTRDIWAVDYMPIQIGKSKFVQFTYDPDYLSYKKYSTVRTNAHQVCERLNIRTTNSPLVIDGGNVIKGKNWVVFTDKIFKENPDYEETKLISELESVLETRVIIIPREPGDYTGHADGILRYYNDDTVLINDYPTNYRKDFQRQLRITLHNAGLKTIQIPYNPFRNKSDSEAHGLYINYLHMKGFLLLPTFGLMEDEANFRLFEELFPDCRVETIDSREVSKDGGVLNCISWNILVQ